MKYTLRVNGPQAHTVRGRYIAIVPDEVAENQKAFDGKSFPVLLFGKRGLGLHRARATLRGELYGLHTPGVGDMIVAIGNK